MDSVLQIESAKATAPNTWSKLQAIAFVRYY